MKHPGRYFAVIALFLCCIPRKVSGFTPLSRLPVNRNAIGTRQYADMLNVALKDASHPSNSTETVSSAARHQIASREPRSSNHSFFSRVLDMFFPKKTVTTRTSLPTTTKQSRETRKNNGQRVDVYFSAIASAVNRGKKVDRDELLKQSQELEQM